MALLGSDGEQPKWTLFFELDEFKKVVFGTVRYF